MLDLHSVLPDHIPNACYKRDIRALLRHKGVALFPATP